MVYQIREMTIGDYEDIMKLFHETPGISVRDADSREATEFYLQRNPGLSFVAVADENIVGCVMSGHDGRRGYLQHLVVRPEYRRLGIGEALFTACLDALQRIGIYKTHIFVFKNNDLGNGFWRGMGWMLRDEINMYSYNRSASMNA